MGVALDQALPPELVLHVLSFLDPADLTTAGRCSRHLLRLSNSSWLWKRLLDRHFAPSALSHPKDQPYKMLYKIAANWRRGYATSTALELRSSVLDGRLPLECDNPRKRKRLDEEERQDYDDQFSPHRRGKSNTLVQFYRHFVFTASKIQHRRRSSSWTAPEMPRIQVFSTRHSTNAAIITTLSSPSLQAYYDQRPHLLAGETSFTPPLAASIHICEMRIDDTTFESDENDGSTSKRLAVFYSTGQFVIFRITIDQMGNLTWKEEAVVLDCDETEDKNSQRVAICRFNSPLLVTLTIDFQLRIWLLSHGAADGKPLLQLSQPILKSSACWWPVVISLTPKSNDKNASDITSTEQYKITMAYSTPFYPSSWTVGVQEFIATIEDSDAASTSVFGSDPTTHKTSSKKVITLTSRHAIAIPQGIRSRTSYNHNNAAIVTSIEYSDPWIVTSRSDNTIQVFRLVSSTNDDNTLLHSPSSSPFSNNSPIFISHHQTLFGHTAAVESISLDKHGRCVSGGADGKVKVWSLNNDNNNHGFGPSNNRFKAARSTNNFRPNNDVVDIIEFQPTEYTDQNRLTQRHQAIKRSSYSSIADSFAASSPSSSLTSSQNRITWLGFDHSRIVSLLSPSSCHTLTSVPSSSLSPSDFPYTESVKIWNFD